MGGFGECWKSVREKIRGACECCFSLHCCFSTGPAGWYGGEGGGCSWSLWEIARKFRSCLFCGRQSQRTFKNTWGVGICIRFFTRWFYCMPYEEKNQHFILSRYFLFFIFAGTQLSLVNVQTNCKRKNVMQPAGTVGAIGIGKGMNSQVL